MINNQEIHVYLYDYQLTDPKDDNWESIIRAMKIFLDCWSPKYRKGLTLFIAEGNTLTINDEKTIIFTLQDGEYNLKIDVDGDSEEFSYWWKEQI